MKPSIIDNDSVTLMKWSGGMTRNADMSDLKRLICESASSDQSILSRFALSKSGSSTSVMFSTNLTFFPERN